MDSEEKKEVIIPEKRKASEILLSLEDKIITVTKMVSTFDMNIKYLLDRVNYVHSYIKQVQALDEADLSAPPASLFPDQPVKISSENIITEETSPVGHRRSSRSEFVNVEVSPQAVTGLTQVQSQDEVKLLQSDKKVPVTQRITDHTGKDIFMAEVSILDENKQLITKTKTNAIGKWQAYLKPGKYNINVIKTDTATKNKIEITQDITIGNSNTSSITTLPVAIMKR